MKKYITSPFFTPIITSVLFLALTYITLMFFPKIDSSTNIFCEVTTYSAYAVMFVAFFYYRKDFVQNGKTDRDFFVFIFIAIFALLREMGIQHWIPSKDSTAFKSRFFLNPENPLIEKIIAGSLLILITVAVTYLVIKYAKHLTVSFFKMNTVSWSVACLCFVGITSKIVDRFPSNYKKYTKTSLSDDIKAMMLIFEENAEVFLPLIVMIILMQYRILKNKKSGSI